jgi:hypothetical protein
VAGTEDIDVWSKTVLYATFKTQPTAIRPMISVLAMLCFATATSSLAGGPRRLCNLSNPGMPDTRKDILCPVIFAFDADQSSSPPTAPKKPSPASQTPMKPMATEMFNRGPKIVPAFELKKVILDDPEQPSVRKTQSEPDLTRQLPVARSTKPNPQQQPTPSSATLPKATKATTGLNRAVGVTGVSESNFDPVNFSFLSDVGKELRVEVVEGSQTVCPTNCPRPRGNNDIEKDMCSQIQCPGVNSLVHSIKLKKKKIKIIKIKKRKTITTTNEHCCAKPNQQCIDDTESNASASVGTEAHKWGVAATKTNGNEMVCDSPSSTNDAVSFDRIDVACQGRRLALQECPFGETGTNMFCWFVFDCLLNVLIKIFDAFN